MGFREKNTIKKKEYLKKRAYTGKEVFISIFK